MNLLSLSYALMLLPLLAGGAALLLAPRGTARLIRIAPLFAGLSLAGAVGGAVLFALGTAIAEPALLRITLVSAVICTVVGFIGVVIVRYSVNALAGEPRHARFLGLMLLTLLFAQLLALAGDAWVLAFAWIGMSVPVQQLLRFYDRPGALLAARLKYGFARASDVALVASLGLLMAVTGTSDLARMVDLALVSGSPLVPVATVLLALTVLLRSAQLPTHSWLLRAIEAPTPVSAVMHAGVVNAGGLLALTFAPLLMVSGPAMGLLALVSGVSLLAALAVMSVETRLKTGLAWSTVAQMAFMLLQVSLGLPGLALLHIAAHALYKSYAFLTAGTLRTIPATTRTHWSAVLIAPAVFLGLVALAMPVVKLDMPSLIVGLMFMLGLAAFARDGRSVAGPLATTITSAIFSVLWLGMHELSGHMLPAVAAQPAAIVIATLVVVMSAGLTLMQPGVAGGWPGLAHLRVHARHGFYIDLFIERLAQPNWRPLAKDAVK